MRLSKRSINRAEWWTNTHTMVFFFYSMDMSWTLVCPFSLNTSFCTINYICSRWRSELTPDTSSNKERERRREREGKLPPPNLYHLKPQSINYLSKVIGENLRLVNKSTWPSPSSFLTTCVSLSPPSPHPSPPPSHTHTPPSNTHTPPHPHIWTAHT